MRSLFVPLVLLLLSVPALADYVVPEQKIVVNSPTEPGEIVKVGVSPIKDRPANLQSTAYTWKVYDGTQQKKNVFVKDDEAWFGAGIKSKKLLVVVAVTHVFVDGSKAVTSTVIYDAEIAVPGLEPGPVPTPTPTPMPPAPQPAEPEPTFADGKYGLAKFTYQTALANIKDASRGAEAKALAESFRKVAQEIKAGGLTTTDKILARTHTANDAAVGPDVIERWEPFTEALQDRIYQLFSSRQIATTADFAQAWEELAQGLAAIK
jgi:hypothetical protein